MDALHKEGQEGGGCVLGGDSGPLREADGGAAGVTGWREYRVRGAPGGSWTPVKALRGIVPEFLLAQGPSEAPCPGGGWVEGPLSRQQPEAGGLESEGLSRYICDWHGAGGGAL